MSANQKKVAFFLVDSENYHRFFIDPLAGKCQPSLVLVDGKKESLALASKGVKKSKIRCTSFMSIRKLSEVLKNEGVECLLVIAHRIPDIKVILAAKKSGCRVSYLQHGMYIPFMKRRASFFWEKPFKSIRYLWYSIEIGLWLRSLSVTTGLLGSFVAGKSRVALRSTPSVFPHKAAVFSHFWAVWHRHFYQFPPESISIVGTPDFQKFKFSLPLEETCVAYCYQTLVEDGRISPATMERFYVDLSTWATKNGLTIAVKSHPRASSEGLQKLKDLGAKIYSSEIPNTAMVIGHYSSLLPFWSLHQRRVFIVPLPGHHPDRSILNSGTQVDGLNDIPIPPLSGFNDYPNLKKYYAPYLGSTIVSSELGLLRESPRPRLIQSQSPR